MPINRGSMRKIEAFVKTWMNQSMDRASVSWLGAVACMLLLRFLFARKRVPEREVTEMYGTLTISLPGLQPFPTQQFPYPKNYDVMCIGLYSLLVVLATWFFLQVDRWIIIQADWLMYIDELIYWTVWCSYLYNIYYIYNYIFTYFNIDIFLMYVYIYLFIITHIYHI